MQSISGMRFPTPNLHDEDYAGMRVALCQIETDAGISTETSVALSSRWKPLVKKAQTLPSLPSL
ncbi:MAG: hypothetical protein CMI16_08145 [Opitutaceae bacterium]|nr:hypothetical protein [Opitutaceae bacterium]|tara:strand:+ start:2628 stop:2819 length:192 start_codon:yes stop_codon:yes gene_type:complete